MLAGSVFVQLPPVYTSSASLIPTVIDQVAAGLILQDFMENTKKGSQLADSESDTEEKNNNKNLEVMNSTAD